MKHSLEELLFAAEVSKRVRGIRNARMSNIEDDEERARILAEPANALIEEAFEELGRVADIISKLRERPRE